MIPKFSVGVPNQPAPLPGVEVVVIRTANLNGPDHRTLGEVQAGETVRVAAGEYYQKLYDDEFVVPVDEFDAWARKHEAQKAKLSAELDKLGQEIDESENEEETPVPQGSAVADAPVADEPPRPSGRGNRRS